MPASDRWSRPLYGAVLFARGAFSGPKYVLEGEVDLATAESLRVGLLAHASVTPGDVTVDCSGLTFIDSSGLGALMAAHRALEGRKLMIENVPPNSLRAFMICGLDKVVTIKPSALSDADSAT